MTDAFEVFARTYVLWRRAAGVVILPSGATFIVPFGAGPRIGGGHVRGEIA